ncbi:Uncharacterised protein [Mycobacteroides abscessus subsp. massiliense]|nr:Uncharacterised protein [Mycobacteroides abscessus subsp. abscessus]SKL36394.1 Uncharacterised protein [Mycobacteroides abscessus subsp. massiliense]
MNVYCPTMADEVLAAMREQHAAILALAHQFYDDIRRAKANGYAFSELEQHTGLSRGSLQRIVAGENPHIRVK